MTNTEAQRILADYLMFHTVTDTELEAFVMAGEALEDDWIPVEKGLPEDGKTVLTYRGDSVHPEGFFKEYGWDFDFYFDKSSPVTHWRHLPKGPEVD